METTVQRIGNSVGVIIPSALQLQAGEHYEVVKIADTIVLTPVKTDLFANPAAWSGFRESVSQEDNQWDKKD